MKIVLKEILSPIPDETKQVLISDKTINERMCKIHNHMANEDLDFLVVYSDLEHGNNFEYLTGFLTRFEEALLIVGKDKNWLITGNENLNKSKVSRIQVEGLHYSPFSLPNQPDMSGCSLKKLFLDLGMKDKKIGIAGWKLINSGFDLPSFVIDELRKVSSNLINATYMFIDPKIGARITNNANEIAHYEYGAALASKGILKALQNVKAGISEKELAEFLQNEGQRSSVVTICAEGKRFEYANMYPSEKTLKVGDPLSLTIGYKGGLQSRACLISAEENNDYLEKIVIPYFKAIVGWLETIKVGIKGKELFDLVNSIIPKDKFNWKLNPGHLCADEEWLSSPIWHENDAVLQSGMIIQFDIIPSISGLPGVSCEGGIALADNKLREDIRSQYPELYDRFMQRRKYMIDVLGIKLNEDVLPMGNADAYYRPFVLSNKALTKEEI